MTKDQKRELLAELLTGNVKALRVYQASVARKDMDGRIFIDSRLIGGPVEIIEPTGTRREITSAEFDALPPQIRASCVVTVIDTTGGHHVPDDDEDYRETDELNQLMTDAD